MPGRRVGRPEGIGLSPVPASAKVRDRFPALAGSTVFLENAGGSQVPRDVPDRIRDYMTSRYVQLGAGYPLSREADAVVADAHSFARLLVNGESGVSALGSSTTVLLRLLADAFAEAWTPGDEIVLARCAHESNVAPWLRLERAGARIRWWDVDPATGESTLDALRAVVGERTRIVAFPHVSNLLGDIVDVAAATRIAHECGARVVVDGVAYAPHRSVDVEAWGVDFYVLSFYKVYGPHLAALWGTREAFRSVPAPTFFFVPEDDFPYRFEPGGASHEACAGLLGTRDYLAFLAGGTTLDRAGVVRAGRTMTEHELPQQRRLLEFLLERDDVRVIGPARTDESRVGTISFVGTRRSSAEITAALHADGIAVRHGHMYAHRLCQAMKLDPDDGVVRVSLVHYNTLEEIERVIDVLRAAL